MIYFILGPLKLNTTQWGIIILILIDNLNYMSRQNTFKLVLKALNLPKFGKILKTVNDRDLRHKFLLLIRRESCGSVSRASVSTVHTPGGVKLKTCSRV